MKEHVRSYWDFYTLIIGLNIDLVHKRSSGEIAQNGTFMTLFEFLTENLEHIICIL